MVKLHPKPSVSEASAISRKTPERLVASLPEKMLWPLSHASGLSPATRQAVEERLGVCMKYCAEKEGHRPAVSEQVLAGVSLGMTISDIARCLELEWSVVRAIVQPVHPDYPLLSNGKAEGAQAEGRSGVSPG